MDWRFIATSVVVSFVIAVALATGVGILGSVWPLSPTEFSWGFVLELAVLMEFVFIVVFMVPTWPSHGGGVSPGQGVRHHASRTRD